jgi:shikimate 5-dehydrogenase
MAVLDGVDEVAALVGAVNTVALRDGQLAGYNTDISGFRDSFVQGLPGASLNRVLQLGAGGAGGAVACALLSLGAARLEILDIRRERAEELAARLRGCRVLNGSGMVIRQAAQAFQILTGREPDATRMARSFYQMPQEPELIVTSGEA